ncbi:MAG: hypothetical protein U9Q30_04345 [Campylobacterota bacterium]|nr:hypothetical protein [Campylobacterota bacterium]
MNANEKIENIYKLTKSLIDEYNDEKFYVYINKTNKFINITTDCNGRNINEWSNAKNDIVYGEFTFNHAISFAKIFNDLHHIEYRETFNIRTNGLSNDIKAF